MMLIIVLLCVCLNEQQQHHYFSADACLFYYHKKTRLTWINGIGYNLQHMNEQQYVISKLFGYKKVEYCHNPTSMSTEDDLKGYLNDLTQAGTQKYLGRVTNEVNLLVAHLKEAVRSVGKNGKVIHIAHSQGALITSLAAKQLTVSEMNQIEVIAFGGAASIQSTSTTPFSRCINYYSVNDPLLLVVPQAEQTLRSGLLFLNEHQKSEFCFLTPRIGDPIADHQLLGPTYRTALQWEGQRYKQTYQSIIERSIRILLMIIIELIRYIYNWFNTVAIPNFEKAKTKIIIQYNTKTKAATTTPISVHQ